MAILPFKAAPIDRRCAKENAGGGGDGAGRQGGGGGAKEATGDGGGDGDGRRGGGGAKPTRRGGGALVALGVVLVPELLKRLALEGSGSGGLDTGGSGQGLWLGRVGMRVKLGVGLEVGVRTW